MLAEIKTVTDIAVPIAVFIGLPLFFWYQRDRKKSRAETAVEERTIDPKVNIENLGAMGAGVALLNEAFSLERASKDRRIKELQEEVREVKRSCEEKVSELEELIDRLRAEVAQLRQERNAS
jgi:hypothetical protein